MYVVVQGWHLQLRSDERAVGTDVPQHAAVDKGRASAVNACL